MDLGGVQYIVGPGRSLRRVRVRKNFGLNQSEVAQTHRFHSARSGANVARMGRFNEHEANIVWLHDFYLHRVQAHMV